MTDIPDLRRMQRITQIDYDRQREGFARILAQESALRAELSRLDAMNRDARAATEARHRAIGADVLWHGWVGRTRTDLNLRLARVLAMKDQHRTRVRKAYGKVLVLDELLSDALTLRKKRVAKQALDRIIDRSLL